MSYFEKHVFVHLHNNEIHEKIVQGTIANASCTTHILSMVICWDITSSLKRESVLYFVGHVGHRIFSVNLLN